MFTGFNEKTTEFLWGIRFNNSRAWFLENKQNYLDHLQAPMRELANDVWTRFTEKNKLDLGYRVARIYRDARRVRDGNLYKEHLWFSLEKDHEDWQSTPVFFFEIEPEGYMYGLGYYAATAETMKKFRARVDSNPAELERIASDLKNKKRFQIDGDEYSRKKGEKEGLLAEWYNRKTISLIASGKGHEPLYSPKFAEKLCKDFQALVPLYNFFWSLEGEQAE
ncbi:TIGR02453 family protein [Sporobacter termitidis DSM 10068]|uniref:TIGR02453 family protein n=1 Tax=Sporobacter termitidis DSM 10068 TaxID=1123282 RepID=A0A1M5VJ80_9FIRM|nr:DUF2461 domain-containing protein [Sporobacter termitidis]SHH75260.1 TIGR02453 family protein [Sporobacter termitidis DSM 10068]